MTGLVDNFMRLLGDQPLSLALVLMNFLLLYFLFKQGNQALSQRQETMALIVQWQQETQQLLANCVNREIMEIVIAALERDRTLYRQMITELGDNFSRSPDASAPVRSPQPTTPEDPAPSPSSLA